MGCVGGAVNWRGSARSLFPPSCFPMTLGRPALKSVIEVAGGGVGENDTGRTLCAAP